MSEAALDRAADDLVDTTASTGFQLTKVMPRTPREMVAEYFHYDLEFAQTPEVRVHLVAACIGFPTDGFAIGIIVDCFILGQWFSL